MGVDDIGLDEFDEVAKLVEASAVAQGVNFADEIGNFVCGDRLGGVFVEGVDAIEHGAFGAIDRAEGEVDIVAEARLTFAGEDGVLLTSAEDEACGDVEDAKGHVCLRVTNPLEAEALWGECGACLAAITGGDDGGDGVGGDAAATDFHECACDDADHVVEETGAADSEDDAIGGGSFDGAGVDGADGGFSAVADLCECGEVVLADEIACGLEHECGVEVVPGVEEVASIPERAVVAGEEGVGVLLGDCVGDGVEGIGDDCGVADEDIAWERAIEGADEGLAGSINWPADAAGGIGV